MFGLHTRGRVVGGIVLGGALALASPAAGAVDDRQALLDRGLGDFDQVHNLSATSSPTYQGSGAARAYIPGGGNAYSRGIFNVNWRDGDEVWFGAAFFLPEGFLSKVQGQVDLLRWDNWATYGDVNDKSAVTIQRSDHRARMVRIRQTVGQNWLGDDTFALPEGRWFWLEMHQKLSSRDGQALSEVYLDGRKVASSTQANTYGRPIDRVRFGIVAIDANRQKNPLQLYFDRAMVSRDQIGPIGGPKGDSGGGSTRDGGSSRGGDSARGGDRASGGDGTAKPRPSGRVVGPVRRRLARRGALLVRARASVDGTLRATVRVKVPGVRSALVAGRARRVESGRVVRYWLKLRKADRVRIQSALRHGKRATVRMRLVQKAGDARVSLSRSYRVRR